VTASIGDFLMLYVALGNAPLDTASGQVLLTLGGTLGVLAIPLYFGGYDASRTLLGQPFSRSTKQFLILSALVALFGALAHGLTALDIFNELSSGATTRRPEDAFIGFLPLAVAGGISAIACLGVNLALLSGGFRADSRRFKQLIWINPVSGTIVLSVLAWLIGDMGQYLSPAAPNLAHALFFAACACCIDSDRIVQRRSSVD